MSSATGIIVHSGSCPEHACGRERAYLRWHREQRVPSKGESERLQPNRPRGAPRVGRKEERSHDGNTMVRDAGAKGIKDTIKEYPRGGV